MIDIDAALTSAIEALLWSEIADDGTPLDSNYGRDDVTEDSVAVLRTAIEAFVAGAEDERADVFGGLSAGQVGHDFVLTSNRHGTGFWDRGLGDRGDLLTRHCRSATYNAYVGDDGRVHVY